MRPGPRGFTLLEAVIAVAVLAILAAAAVPSYTDHLARQRLRHAAELLELDLRRARALSVEDGREVHVSFRSGRDWCWGISREAACDCAAQAARCELGTHSSQQHRGTLLQAGQGVSFEAGKGRALGWVRIGMSNDRHQQLHIDLNPMGRPAICGADARKGAC
jgi:type IV fimbrial biogenesis protein FimT